MAVERFFPSVPRQSSVQWRRCGPQSSRLCRRPLLRQAILPVDGLDCRIHAPPRIDRALDASGFSNAPKDFSRGRYDLDGAFSHGVQSRKGLEISARHSPVRTRLLLRNGLSISRRRIFDWGARSRRPRRHAPYRKGLRRRARHLWCGRSRLAHNAGLRLSRWRRHWSGDLGRRWRCRRRSILFRQCCHLFFRGVFGRSRTWCKPYGGPPFIQTLLCQCFRRRLKRFHLSSRLTFPSCGEILRIRLHCLRRRGLGHLIG